jgi:hypothetical protein
MTLLVLGQAHRPTKPQMPRVVAVAVAIALQLP